MFLAQGLGVELGDDDVGDVDVSDVDGAAGAAAAARTPSRAGLLVLATRSVEPHAVTAAEATSAMATRAAVNFTLRA